MTQNLTEFLSSFLSKERLTRIDEVICNRTRHLTIVLENITHSHNASACLRTCDCFGIQDVHIIDAINSFQLNPDITRGSSKWLTIHRYQSNTETADQHGATSERCIANLRNLGYRILTTSPCQKSVPLHEVDVTEKTAIILGSEKFGVSQTAIANSDELVHVPMFGFTESFNVSVSAAILLQHLTEKLHRSGADWPLKLDERRELVELWIRKSLGNKLDPLCRRFVADSKQITTKQ